VPFDEERVSAALSGVIDGDVDTDDPFIQGLESDLRFQAELVQYRKLMRALHSLRLEVVDPGPALADEVLATVDEGLERHGVLAVVTTRRLAYIGGIAAATAAGVGSAFVLARRRAA
jgi:hypothetical protein